jgi:hypothetical protein
MSEKLMHPTDPYPKDCGTVIGENHSCHNHEVAWIAWKARQSAGSIVEIGTYKGETARQLAIALPDKVIYTVDLPLGTSGYELLAKAPDLVGWLTIGLPNVRLNLTGSSEFVIPEGVGLIFIDGDHQRVLPKDSAKAIDYFKKRSGTIVWHDVHHPASRLAQPDKGMFYEVYNFLNAMDLPITYVATCRLAYCDF